MHLHLKYLALLHSHFLSLRYRCKTCAVENTASHCGGCSKSRL